MTITQLHKNTDIRSLKNERWRWVVGYENYYMVSSLGRVKSMPRKVTQRFKREALRRKRILSQRVNRYGYCGVTLFINESAKDKLVHTLVAQAFISNPENKTQVNHKKGIKTDNRATQLEWSTPKENSNHAIKLGIDSVVGVHNGMSKITEKQAVEIKREYKTIKHGNRKEAAKKYNITLGIFRRIGTGNSWKHLN